VRWEKQWLGHVAVGMTHLGNHAWVSRMRVKLSKVANWIILCGHHNKPPVWFSSSEWPRNLCHGRFFPTPVLSQEAMCAHPYPGTSRLFLKKNLLLDPGNQVVLPICLFKTTI
jgi:hypothetical protein